MVKDKNYYNSLDKRSKEYKQWKLSQIEFTETVGLGDVIDKITTKTGIKKVVKAIVKDCGCDKRKDKLNETPLFTRGLKPRCFTDEEYKEWGVFIEVRTLKITEEQRIYICGLYSIVFNKPYYEPNINNRKPIDKMIDNLDKVYNNA